MSKKKTKYEIELMVGGSGLVAEFWALLARTVYQKGGGADDLHRLTRPEGLPIVQQMADLVVSGAGTYAPDPRFTLVDAGQLTVPVDYDPRIIVDALDPKDFSLGFDKKINSQNFAKTSARLVPGKTYGLMRADVVRGTTISSEDCLKFIKSHQGNLMNAQGGALVSLAKREALPRDRISVFFDEKEYLPVLDEYLGVFCVSVYSDRQAHCSLGSFENDWYDNYSLFFLRDPQLRREASLPTPSA